ncbi:MAG: ribosome small subunit-dependent GTPase A [Candidatus Eisenbacteria bacterium]|nr:ribosome small subunit-dependent GTPase A [Candidatus Eisenbacteria bacterium]
MAGLRDGARARRAQRPTAGDGQEVNEMDLHRLGWNRSWAQKLKDLQDEGLSPARVARADRGLYQLLSASGAVRARLSGRLRHHASSAGEFPTTGDWVAVRSLGQAEGAGSQVMIHALLPRQSAFRRQAVIAGGRTQEQTVAANVDVAFLVSGLDIEFNVRRIERYVSIAWDSGAFPVLLLNKSDLADNPTDRLRETARAVAPAPVHAISALREAGLEQVRAYLEAGKTYGFLGSSGVGKSSIINALLGEERQAVSGISHASGKGRHTTTRRELILLPGGAIVLDTPGMKVIGAWSDEEGVGRTFSEIEELASRCRFRDCRHASEPGCAVRAAIEAGELDPARLRSFRRLSQEAASIEQRKKELARLRRLAHRDRIVKGSASAGSQRRGRRQRRRGGRSAGRHGLDADV